jgi:hypothetical protein
MIFFLLCLIRIVFIRLAVQQKLFVIYIYIYKAKGNLSSPLHERAKKGNRKLGITMMSPLTHASLQLFLRNISRISRDSLLDIYTCAFINHMQSHVYSTRKGYI